MMLQQNFDLIIPKSVDLITICFGANDAAINSEQTVDLQTFKQNMIRIAQIAQKICSNILIIAPTPMLEPFINRTNKNTLLYVKCLEDLGSQLSLKFKDIRTLWKDEHIWVDGGHLNTFGNKLFASLIKPYIK